MSRPINGPLDFTDVGRYGAQLFFAGMPEGRGRRPSTPPPPLWPPGRPVSHRQLVLFDMPRDLRGGRGCIPQPQDTALAEVLDALALQVAAAKGWGRSTKSQARAGVRLLLGMQDTPGAVIGLSECAVLPRLTVRIRPVVDVLNAAGMLHDDRTASIQRWFTPLIASLPQPMATELTTWFDVMLHGSATTPRRRPRSPTTIRLYSNWLLPALRAWADAGHASLREITRDDVLAALPPSGLPRSTTGQALRSLFNILKARRVVFTNPTAGIPTWAPSSVPPLPIDLAPLRVALDSPNPARALLAALTAFHALTSGQLRALQLTDLHDRRLHLSRDRARQVPLADPVRHRLTAYLDHRAARWPHSPNPHLFIHFRTAARTEAVGARWIRCTLDLPGSASAVRQDRILHEAIATGGDTRRLCDLFGLSIHAASRYSAIVREPTIKE